MLEKIFDLIAGDKLDGAKLHLVLIILGLLIVFFSEKIPVDVSIRGVMQLIGVIVFLIGVGLLLISVIDRNFHVSTISGLSDGLVSGLISTFLISSIFFAPKGGGDDDFFLYRVLITVVYGMLYGSFIGLFSIFFIGNFDNIKRFFTAFVSVFVAAIFSISYFLLPEMPVVSHDALTAGDLFLMHLIFIPIFTIIHRKGFDLLFKLPTLLFYPISTSLLFLLLVTVKSSRIYPGYDWGEEVLWDSTLYVDFKPSYYFFGFMMVALFLYASANLAVIFAASGVRDNRVANGPPTEPPSH